MWLESLNFDVSNLSIFGICEYKMSQIFDFAPAQEISVSKIKKVSIYDVEEGSSVLQAAYTLVIFYIGVSDIFFGCNIYMMAQKFSNSFFVS